MVNISVNNNSHSKCFQCASELIFVSQETVLLEGARYPQINTIYRCSNAECQKKKDKEIIDRLKLKQNRAITQKERMERIQKMRKLYQESKN